jgi:hypothetical protein
MTLRSAKELLGYKVTAFEAKAGYIYDIYFDDKIWVIRHLVVDLGDLIPGRKILISPDLLGQPDWETERVPVKLTLDQILQKPTHNPEVDDPHLRSLADMIGCYKIQASDGESGHLEDFVLDARFWTIRYLVVKIRTFWPNKQVSLIPQWVKAIDQLTSQIQVILSRTTIENCPEYFSSFYTKQPYAVKFYDYNGKQPQLNLTPAQQVANAVYL